MNRPVTPADIAEAVQLPLHDTVPKEQTPHERRKMLIEGCKEFDAKIGQETAEEAVDRMVAEGKLNLEPTDHPEEEIEEFNWDDGDSIVLTEQYATAIYFNPAGELVIRQRRWPDEDQFIFINRGFTDTFIDRLTDALGIPSFGGPEPKPAPVRKS